MIVYIGCDPEILHQATRDHLRLLRVEYEACENQAQQHDVVLRAKTFYLKEPETLQMENDLQYSDKPKF